MAQEESPKEIEFKIKYAETSLVWQAIEGQLCTLFVAISDIHPTLGRAIFYSARSFLGRYDMLSSALDVTIITNEHYKEIAQKILKRIKTYSGSRNRLAHGEFLHISIKESKYYGSTIILEPSQPWVLDPPENSVTTLEKLDLMHNNFSNIFILLSKLNDGTFVNNRELASQCLEMLDELPRQADGGRLGPNLAALVAELSANISIQRQ